jgi:hypothetical protein
MLVLIIPLKVAYVLSSPLLLFEEGVILVVGVVPVAVALSTSIPLRSAYVQGSYLSS